MSLPLLLVLALVAVLAGLWVGSTARHALGPAGAGEGRPTLSARLRRALLARLLHRDRE